MFWGSEMLRQVWDRGGSSAELTDREAGITRARTLHCSFPGSAGSQSFGRAWQSPVFAPSVFWGASPATAIRAALGEPHCCPALSPWGRDTLSFCLPCLPRALLGFKNILSQTVSKDTNLLVCSLTPRAAHGTNAGKLQA